jgi:hypothetical protein
VRRGKETTVSLCSSVLSYSWMFHPLDVVLISEACVFVAGGMMHDSKAPMRGGSQIDGRSMDSGLGAEVGVLPH